MPKRIRGISFDFGSTLLNYVPCISIVWSKIAKQLGVEILPDDPRVEEGIRRQHRAYLELGIPEYRLTRDDWSYLNRHVLDAIEIDWEGVDQERLQKIIEEGFDRAFQTGEGFELFPSTRDTLERVHSMGLKIGLLSNCPASLGTARRKLMKTLGILEFFDAIILSGEVGSRKPEREIFEITLTKLGIKEARRVIHVGDDLTADVQGAKNAGLIPVLFDPQGLHSVEDVITIRKMPDILDILQYRIS